jgi:hypothetical protein
MRSNKVGGKVADILAEIHTRKCLRMVELFVVSKACLGDPFTGSGDTFQQDFQVGVVCVLCDFCVKSFSTRGMQREASGLPVV